MPSNRILYESVRTFMHDLDKHYGLLYLTDNRPVFADAFSIDKSLLVGRFQEAYWLRGTSFLLFCRKYSVSISAISNQFILDAQTGSLKRGWGYHIQSVGELHSRAAKDYKFYCDGFVQLDDSVPIIATRVFNVAEPANALLHMP